MIKDPLRRLTFSQTLTTSWDLFLAKSEDFSLARGGLANTEPTKKHPLLSRNPVWDRRHVEGCCSARSNKLESWTRLYSRYLGGPSRSSKLKMSGCMRRQPKKSKLRPRASYLIVDPTIIRSQSRVPQNTP